MQGSQPLVMDALRESTKELHADTEGHQFQKDLGSGRVRQDLYVKYLGQLFLMHKHLADLLPQAAAADPRIAAVLAPYHSDLSALVGDLGYFDATTDSVVPLTATTALLSTMDELAVRSPLSLLGLLYVLEGSTNGAKFMAKTLRKGLNLPEDRGAKYFDRYGDLQRERWTNFKATMNAQGFEQGEIDALVVEAKRMFQTFFEIGSELETC
jgi:heme oxygenase (biliverdin-IX-beta and delta-forming)